MNACTIRSLHSLHLSHHQASTEWPMTESSCVFGHEAPLRWGRMVSRKLKQNMTDIILCLLYTDAPTCLCVRPRPKLSRTSRFLTPDELFGAARGAIYILTWPAFFHPQSGRAAALPSVLPTMRLSSHDSFKTTRERGYIGLPLLR